MFYYPLLDADCPDLGLLLSQARIKVGKTVEGVADETGRSIRAGGISRADLSRLENNQMPLRRLRITTLLKLLEIYNCGSNKKEDILQAYECLKIRALDEEKAEVIAEIQEAREEVENG